MTKGRSVKRVKINSSIFSKLQKDRKNYNSDNAHLLAIGLNNRTYKYVFNNKECRTDVLDKIENHLNSVCK